MVQNDRDNQRLTNNIVVQITSVTRRGSTTQALVKIATPEGQPCGLRQDSVVNCVNILTLDQGKTLRKLGDLSPPLLQKVDDCLMVAVGLRP